METHLLIDVDDSWRCDVVKAQLCGNMESGKKKLLTPSLVSNCRAVRSKADDLFCFMFITSTSSSSSSTFICSNHLIEMHLIHFFCCCSSFPALHEDGNHRPQITDVMMTLIITPCARSDPHVTGCILKTGLRSRFGPQKDCRSHIKVDVFMRSPL